MQVFHLKGHFGMMCCGPGFPRFYWFPMSTGRSPSVCFSRLLGENTQEVVGVMS